VEQKEFWQKEMQFWTKDLNRYINPTSAIKSTAAELVAPSDAPLDKAKKTLRDGAEADEYRYR
jgi:hypothetical protein